MLHLGSPSGVVPGRRHFLGRGALGIGGLALGGLSLTDLLTLRTATAASGEASPLASGKSCVFLFMHGGPSQFETFDPNMQAASEIRSVTGEMSTAIPGVTFSGSLPKLASRADRLAIVRSFQTGSGNHDIKPIVCRESLDANLGALYSRVVGASDPASGMPTNAALFPKAVNDSTMPKVTQFGNFLQTGLLGGAYSPFEVGGEGDLQQNMNLNVPLNRLGDRRTLLGELDRLRTRLDRQTTDASPQDPLREQAFQTILGGIAEAFDLSREDPKTIAAYDTEPLVNTRAIDRKWNNHARYADNAKSLGKLMLLARRLCEAGCGFVTVTTNFVWDMHADANNAGVEEGMRYMGGPFDHAVSAFLDDCEARGLSDDILLVCCGEMGRTPKLTSRGGRNHWGRLAPLILAGGGLDVGQVIGQSDHQGGEPQSTPVGNRHLIATILQTLLDAGEVRLRTDLPADLLRLVASDPIPGLLS